MTHDTPRLAIILASIRDGRFGPTVADWFTAQAETSGHFDLDVVDLADSAAIGMAGPGGGGPEVAAALEVLTPRLAAADAFVVVTPEYNHSYPASLKAVIDAHYTEWRAKPVGFVSYGGVSGGLRAVEHLRTVFAELHAVTVRDTVSFASARAAFGPDGRTVDQSGPHAAAKALLDQLAWWATALNEARAKSPYQV